VCFLAGSDFVESWVSYTRWLSEKWGERDSDFWGSCLISITVARVYYLELEICKGQATLKFCRRFLRVDVFRTDLSVEVGRVKLGVGRRTSLDGRIGLWEGRWWKLNGAGRWPRSQRKEGCREVLPR
jgi:hypothetical protein